MFDAGPAPTCVTGNGGVWSSEFKPKEAAATSRRLQVRGRPEVNANEPLMMPRHVDLGDGMW